MTNDIAIRDDLKSVERWENEGGRVSPLNHLWASLKRFTTEDKSRKGQVIDAQKSPRRQFGVFAGLNTMYGAVVGRVRELSTLQALGFRRRPTPGPAAGRGR